jgi:hypothetical protein
MSIGGYFELELPQGDEYHKNALRLNTGRNAFEYILRAKHYKKVYLPYYTCDVMLEPINKLNIDFEFYNIDKDFAPIFNFSKIKPSDVFVYTNYFGICDKPAQHISQQCKNIIIDNSQAFYSLPLPGVDTFYSPRKFFGLPDGAYLYTDKKLEIELEQDVSINRFEHLLGRIEHEPEDYYLKFKENSHSLVAQPIKIMSKLTQRLLQSIDYTSIAKQRKNNFLYLHNELNEKNEIQPKTTHDTVPMVYPLFVKNGAILKRKLIQNKVFLASYWPNVIDWCDKANLEYQLNEHLVNIPIDQRYHIDNMKFIIEYIKQL